MPGAALKALGLPYKGYKNGARKLQLRREILDGLAVRSSVPIENLEEFREKCLASHDCLDAVVAAVIAALWARNPAVFRHPLKGADGQLDPTTLIEGWLYAPVLLREAF
jgi:predicted RNase H-like nuclease